jgi:hypothetical protein
MEQSCHEFGCNRRQFIRAAAMTSGAALLAGQRLAAGANSPEPGSTQPFGVLAPLPPGAVRASGWLQRYLEKQAAQLGSQLPIVSWPFTGAYWAGEEATQSKDEGRSWWPWEQKAYWIDGAARLALVLEDKQLLRKALAPVNYTLTHAGADGYLGPNTFKALADGYGRWPQNVFFRALLAASDANAVSGIPAALQKHYLNDAIDYGKSPRNFTNIEDMLWCYERTGDTRLLALADKSWQEFSRQAEAGAFKRFPAQPDYCDLSSFKVYGAGPIDSHGVDYAEASKQPAILYLYTGKLEYLQFALAAQRRVFDHHMLIDGAPSTSEWYRTTTSLDSHETCDIVDHSWSWIYMLRATGDSIWSDRVERASFNAGFGALKKDWKGLQYFSFPNQVSPTEFQPNPGHSVACCGGNVHRLLPNYVINMWMRTVVGGLAATLYGPSRVKTKVGDGQDDVEIVQQTDYPFGEEIHFTINAKQSVSFPLSLRIPQWCHAASLLINDKATAMPEIKNGFVTVKRQFKPGDTVTLILPMKAAVTRWPQNGIGIEHGPLVYSLGVKEEWSSKVEPQYSTAELPTWKVVAASQWNYGLALGSGGLETEVKLVRKPMTEDPWIDSPVTLTVPARKIENWELQADADNPDQKFTPPLPILGSSKIGDTVEQLALVPYGSTHLRITIFPELAK